MLCCKNPFLDLMVKQCFTIFAEIQKLSESKIFNYSKNKNAQSRIRKYRW